MSEQSLKPPILVRLKSETRRQHEQMEATVDIFNRVTSLSSYRALLARLCGFYAPLEQAMASRMVAWPSTPSLQQLDWPKRQKTPLLQRDLLALGLDVQAMSAMPMCPSAQLPQLKRDVSVWGCVYVFEGATLGGAVIARHLQQAFGLHAHNGAAFYNAYGQDVGPMWKIFGQAITEFASISAGLAAHTSDESAIVHAAGETFECLRAWLQPLG